MVSQFLTVTIKWYVFSTVNKIHAKRAYTNFFILKQRYSSQTTCKLMFKYPPSRMPTFVDVSISISISYRITLNNTESVLTNKNKI